MASFAFECEKSSVKLCCTCSAWRNVYLNVPGLCYLKARGVFAFVLRLD